ncbi:MAG: alpha/beta fold hydrolase [Alphaproteobacteria bacterium]|nr:alpha/beta fold hydrolase [Alphaproteobacteria bacterium]
MRIAKHFVSVGQRRVHYFRAGKGPALVLLHASACSAKVLRPLIEAFAGDFTVIALDTPGFGLSDKLSTAAPRIEDFADALAETLDALGIRHVAVQGRHTGASIAAEFAARHPERCAMALTDGYPLLAGDYDEARIAQYLKPIEPAWDGSHLVWLWFRYRDQHAFWPWNAQRLRNRADTDIPDLDFLHRGVIEFLEAGNDYRLGYAAPFRHDAAGLFQRLRVPVCFGTRPGDWLHHMTHLYPPGTWHEVMPREGDDAAERERTILKRNPATGTVPPPPACAALPGRPTTDYASIDGTSLLLRAAGQDRPGEPVLLLPALPGSSALYDELLMALAAYRPVFSLDLPGHGESDPLPGNPQDVETWARAALAVLDRLGLARVQLYGHQGGASVAVELALRQPARFGAPALEAPIVLEAPLATEFARHFAPDLAPCWEGAHLLRAWHHVRDQELWWPWYRRQRGNARTHEPRIEPAALTARVREILKQPASFQPAWRALIDYPLAERMRRLAVPPLLVCAAEDAFAPAFAAARAARPDAAAVTLPDTSAARARLLSDRR